MLASFEWNTLILLFMSKKLMPFQGIHTKIIVLRKNYLYQLLVKECLHNLK